MAKAWTVPTGGDLWQIVSRSIVEQADEDVAGGTQADNDFDDSLDTRAKEAVNHAVAEIRGAIESAGRYPLSVTEGGVPPEAFQYALAMGAWRLCVIKPSLMSVLFADGGSFSPLRGLYKEALDWLKKVSEGGSFVLPTDPTGVDYTTAVSSSNPAISGIVWGDSLADGDEYAAGITADGVAVSRFSQNMNTN